MKLCKWLLVAVCCLVLIAPALGRDVAEIGRQVDKADNGGQILALAQEIAGQIGKDGAGLTVDQFVVAADTFGKLVARARDKTKERAIFEQFAKLGGRLQDSCRAKIRGLEAQAGDNEAALEALYRSDAWHNINYAAAAFNYWRAWALLAVAQTYPPSHREQVKWLNPAEQGFQQSSVRILYPGIVYGSWLGMGYAALTRGEPEAAEQRFQRLVSALGQDSTNPVREIAQKELTALAAGKGKQIAAATAAKSGAAGAELNTLIEETFTLLEQQRRKKTGAIGAGRNLRQIIKQGGLDDALLNRLLTYRDEIAGQDLGVLSLLIDAEYAYAYQQYTTAAFKFREFRDKGGLKLPISTGLYHYHFVVALLKANLPQDARAELGALRRKKAELPAGVAAAIPKLAFLIDNAIFTKRDNPVNRKALRASATAFLAASPKDPDVGSAHLALAQVSDDNAAADRHLQAARGDRKLAASVGAADLQRQLAAFNKAAFDADIPGSRRLATSILKGLADLPGKQRKQPWFRALALQMRAAVGGDEPKVLKEIDALWADPGSDDNVKEALLWAKLRALDASQPAAVDGFIRQLGGRKAAPYEQKQIYQFLVVKERLGDYLRVAALCEAFYPALAGQTQDQRQIRLIQIRALVAGGRGAEALALAQKMIQDFPKSGDAWMAYAQTAEKLGQPADAERGWAKISGAEPDGSPRWRSSMLKRLDLLSALPDRGRDACSLVERLSVYKHLLTAAEKKQVAGVAQQRKCGAMG